MRLGLFTDPHYCNKELTCRNRRPVLSYGKVLEAMEHFRAAHVDLVLCLGDLIDDCGDKQLNAEKTVELISLIRSYDIPFYSLMGNHDAHVFTKEEFNHYTDDAFPPTCLHVKGKTLIFPDTNYNDDGTPYAPGKINWKNSCIPDHELAALTDILAHPDTEEAYIFTHQNLDPEVQVDHILRNAEAVREIIHKSGKVRTVFQGHYHKGHENMIDGIPYRTLPAMCEGERNMFEIVVL